MIDNDQQDRELTPIEREAHAWVRRLTSGHASAADGAALREWCSRNPGNAAAFSEASQFWTALGSAGRSLREDAGAQKRGPASRRHGVVTTRRAVLAGALAASAAGVMIVRPPLELWPSLSELRADYRTGPGEQRQISLADEVSVQMDSKTSLAVAPAGGAAGVELIAGQASFKLPEQGVAPFRVIAGQGRSSAVKAHFDIRLAGTSVCVTCLSHQVDIDYRGQRAVLQERQQVFYGERGLGAVATIDPAVVSAWQTGLLIFNMTPLREVIDELNRYRSGRIILLASRMAGSPVKGRFRIDRPDEALAQIQRAFDVERRDLPGGIVLLS
ncbi:putative FecR [Rhodopseudomonas palustris HaA2]|uniref:Putative FecR n=1 Tax=Rhodopseudomonas palustris (strain HaA2) TaxID=316058 RepID=Q2IXZ9_RHOP2|nr:FecR domain-containing protein [Rhodopseudomonas palustris]ABD06911.1 putative FecR [Rhodopseudomonas palustris HaA2]